MTQQEFLSQKRNYEVNITLIKDNLNLLKYDYLQQLIDESSFKIGQQYMYGKQKVWIHSFKLDVWVNEVKLKVVLYKVRKDGTNGNSPENIYGTNIAELKPCQP